MNRSYSFVFKRNFRSWHHQSHGVENSHIDTIFARAGCEVADPVTGAIVPPIHFSTTYERDKNLELTNGYNYTRLGNPTRRLLESTIAKLENGTEGFAFSSGMQAATSLLLSSPNFHVILPDDKYYAVQTMCHDVLKHWGLSYEQSDMTNLEEIELKLKSLKPKNGNVLFWLESPSNPKCKVSDIRTLSTLARSILGQDRVTVVVDSTWVSPYITRPLDLGADIVLHSSTKYIGGHTDILGGLVVVADTAGAKLVTEKLRTVHQVMCISTLFANM